MSNNGRKHHGYPEDGKKVKVGGYKSKFAEKTAAWCTMTYRSLSMCEDEGLVEHSHVAIIIK